MATDSKDGKNMYIKTLERWEKIWNVKRLQTDVSDGRCSPETAGLEGVKIEDPWADFIL